ncbi:MAG TPA: hypothetical protein GX405_04545 [Rhizobiales bacterium]|nr:hypothetical protein [Hyphomicrobiales bacterium]
MAIAVARRGRRGRTIRRPTRIAPRAKSRPRQAVAGSGAIAAEAAQFRSNVAGVFRTIEAGHRVPAMPDLLAAGDEDFGGRFTPDIGQRLRPRAGSRSRDEVHAVACGSGAAAWEDAGEFREAFGKRPERGG